MSASHDPNDSDTLSKLLPRQEAFCRNYVVQPVATRAAVLAGYAARSAHNQGHRLLRCAEILERIEALRAERKLTYVLERDTMIDKLDGVFLDAFECGKHAPAIAAIRLQVELQGLRPGARGRMRRKKMSNAASRRPK